MKSAALFVLVLLTLRAVSQVPQILNYQGRVVVGSTNFDGTGQFKFALVNGTGTVTFWSNNGTSTAGSQPTAGVSLPVAKGLYSVSLGDTALTNMTAVPATVFNNADVRLRVWFNDGTNGFQQLTPDQRIASTGFAMKAESANTAASATALSGPLTAANVPADLITGTMIQDGQIGSLHLAPSVDFGSANASGDVDLFSATSDLPGISLRGGSYQISTYGSDGLEQIRLWGPSYGELLLFNSTAANDIAVKLSADGTNGGILELRNDVGLVRATLRSAANGGELTLRDTTGTRQVVLQHTGDSYLTGGSLGIGITTPDTPLDVQATGTDDGGVAGFAEVTARFLRSVAGHSAASIDAITGQDSILYLAENGLAQWGLRQDSDDGHSFQLRYQAGGANATALRVTSGGDARVTGSITAGKFNVVSLTALSPVANATLIPTTGYVKLAPAAAITLNATTAIADGSTPGQTLILQGTSNINTVTVNDNANVQLGGPRTLGLNDMLTLLWDGTNWIETAFANN